MRSIRRSLTLYLLALLGAGLGAVAVLTDRVVGRTLGAWETASTALIDARSDERCRDAEAKLDAALLAQAKRVYDRMQLRYAARVEHEYRTYRVLLAAAEYFAEPALPLGRPGWAVGVARGGPVVPAALRYYFDHLRLDDQLADADPDPPGGLLVQVNISSRTGGVWRSAGMAGATFPDDAPGLTPGPVTDEAHDTQTVNGVEVRRAVFKGPLVAPWGRFPGRPPGPRPRDREAGPPPPPPDRVREAFPRISVHCGRPRAGLEAEFVAIRADRDGERAALAAAVRRERADLRLWLAGIGASTFLGIVLGGPGLVRRGLAPLRHLSDAVSRVSEKDFRLPADRAALSVELLPIHARLSATLDALRRAFDREKEAVADISHELRTPVAGLLATLDVALRRPRTADQYRAALEDARGIGRQLAGLVERVLALARLDAGAARPAPVPTDAAEVAGRCAAVVRPLAEAAGVAFTADLAEAGLLTDPDELREVVVNLLHNAVEYNRPGGTIRLAVRPRPDGGAEVVVADTGIGMGPEVRRRIFERFYRADPSRQAAGVHAGLGLAIVKEYVERLGGTIRVESAAGVGTTFTVTLPGGGTGARAADEALVGGGCWGVISSPTLTHKFSGPPFGAVSCHA